MLHTIRANEFILLCAVYNISIYMAAVVQFERSFDGFCNKDIKYVL